MAREPKKGRAGGKGPPSTSTLPPAPKPKVKKARAKKPVDRFAGWDAEKVAAECKASLLAKQKAARGPLVVPEGAMPVGDLPPRKRKPKVETTLEPGPVGGKLKRSRAEPIDRSIPAKPERASKPDVPMTDALFTAILLEIASGVPLRQTCRRIDMPSKSEFYRYIDGDDLEDGEAKSQSIAGRIARYARARKLGFDDIAEEALEIADDGTNDWVERERDDGSTYEALNGEHVQRSKLRVDTRLKLLSKWDPKGYGDALKLGDLDGRPLDRAGKSVSDLAIDIAKLMVAAEREAGGVDEEA